MDLFEESALDTTVAVAQSLATRAGLPAAFAAVIALIDAIEGGRWRAGPLDAAFAELAGADRPDLVAAVETLIGAGVVLEANGNHRLAPHVRQLLARRGDASTSQPAAELAELSELLAPHAAIVVAVVADPPRAVAEIVKGLGRSVAILSDRADLHAVRDAWLRDDVVAIAPTERLWISPVSRVPVRLVACLDVASAGETIALLRRHHRVAVWRAPVARRPRVAPPAVLEPLVYTIWNGLRTPSPAVRVVALRGTGAEVEWAGTAVAAAHGLPLVRAAGKDFASLRAALTAPESVAALDDLGELAPLPAAAIGALLAQTTSIVMVSGDDLPGPVAELPVIDLTGRS
ncbi:MAG: hypothetical protein ABI467_12045 [Kofleriaceae bacterium]